MSDYSELIEQCESVHSMVPSHEELFREAATAIRELSEKVDRLTSRGIEDLRFENDELRAELAALREPWIPVSERLPEINGEVLCRYKDQYCDMQVVSYYDDVDIYFQVPSVGQVQPGSVTHWMPLPPPPAEPPK